jgi:hypothetical protein
MGMADNYVSAILPQPDGKPLIGLYIGGVIKPKTELRLNKKDITKQGKKDNQLANKDFPKLPSTIKPPTIDELRSMQAKLEKLNKPLPKVYAAYYGEDWKTQGDWVGHYGRVQAIMCAASSPMDHFFFHQPSLYLVHSFIGPNSEKDDTIRRWVHWLQSEDPRVMYSPIDGYRRQAEWDDHGEVYPTTKDGPDLWYVLEIKEQGVFRVGMYFFNKDGHTGNNRMRDYIIQVYDSPMSWITFRDRHIIADAGEKLVAKQRPLFQTRVMEFWGGVHKSFYVNTPCRLLVKIDRNYSFNTVVSSVTIDRVTGKPSKRELQGLPTPMNSTVYDVPEIPNEFISPVAEEVTALWKKTDSVQGKIKGMIVANPMRVAAFRAAVAIAPRDTPSEHYDVALANAIRWRLRQWNPEMRNEFNEVMIDGRKRFSEEHPDIVRGQKEQLEKRKNGTWKNPLEGITVD